MAPADDSSIVGMSMPSDTMLVQPSCAALISTAAPDVIGSELKTKAVGSLNSFGANEQQVPKNDTLAGLMTSSTAPP